MEIIDENGNLFGAVNVIDALAVLLVLAVVVAGVAVVGTLGAEEEDTDEPEIETRYATLDFSTQSESVAQNISSGDEMELEDHPHSLTITDVYATPVASDDIAVTLRAEVEGTVHEDGTYAFGGDEFVTGQNVSVATDDYEVTADIEAVEETGTEFTRNETDVLFEETVSPAVADEISAGDEVEFGGETMATVETTSVYPVSGDEYRLIGGATLTMLEHNDQLWYGQDAVESGSSISLSTEEYDLSPEILETDTLEEAGEPTTTTVEVDLEELSEREADQFERGLTDSGGADTWATIVDVDRQPASIIVETDDGQLHERQHPTRVDLTLTLELHTRETDRKLTFKGDTLENGDTIYLDFGITSIEERAWIVD